MSNSTQNDWGLAKIIKIEIEEVPEGYIKPYISVAKRKHHFKSFTFVEDMFPTQEETFTIEAYPLILFGFSKKYRQGFYVKKEFQAMFESLFKEFMELEYERGKADARKEVLDRIQKEVEGGEMCVCEKCVLDLIATLREEEKHG